MPETSGCRVAECNLPGAASSMQGGEGAAGDMSDEAQPSPVVLYRCPTPTNWLCPCGTVERRLRKLGLEHRTERTSYRRSARPEIEELTRQRRVPVLVDGDEVVHDSKRILQYLDWKYGRRAGIELGSDAGGAGL